MNGREIEQDCYTDWYPWYSGSQDPTRPISIEREDLDLDLPPGERIRVEDGGSTVLFASETGARFEITDGELIRVDRSVTGEALRWHLLGPLSRTLLLQRGEFLLHASVVQIGTATVAFVAPSGAGKSTVAAGLYDRGHDVLSDDVGVIRFESGPEVLRGPPVLKLHEQSAGYVDRRLHPVFPDGLETGKRYYRLDEPGDPTESSLDMVFLLDDDDEIRTESVSARDAAVAFLENTWGLPREDGPSIETFQRASALAESVPVTRLRYPRSFETFDDVLRRIEEAVCDDR